MSDHENLFIDRLSPYIENTTTDTLDHQLDQLKKPHPSSSKSAAQSSRFNISDEISIKVKYQKAVGKATKLPLKSLRADNNSKVSTSQVHRLGDSKVDSHNLIRAYHYGSILVPRPDESEGGFVEFTSEAGIDFLSTFPASTFKRDMVIGEPSFIYADQSDGSSGLALSSFINALDKNGLIALVRYARTKDEKPYLGLCLPIINGQTEYLQYLRIPFADQMRNYSFPSLERVVTKSGEPLQNHKYLPTDKMCLAMDNFVNSMDLHDTDDKRTWFDINTSYTPAHHRIYQAVIHGASTGSIIKDELQDAHPELKKYLEPPSFAQKRSIDALENCKNEFNLTKPTPKAKYHRRHSKEDVREAQEINIDDLLGGKPTTSPRPVDKTIEGDAKKGTDGAFTPDQVWQTLNNLDDPEEVYENNIAEDYNELIREVKEDTQFWSFLRENEGEKLSLITSGEDEHGTSEVTSSQSRNKLTTMFARSFIRQTGRQATRAFSTARASNNSLRNVAFGVGAAAALGATALATKPVHLDAPQSTIAGTEGTFSERSFVMIKPDGVSRQIVGKIISRFEERGYKLVAVKTVTPSKELAKEHYIDLAARPFYPGLVEYITSGTPVVALVWEGKDVIRQGRRMVGATNPLQSDPGSIRGTYAVSVGRNIIHASDSFESATKEIGLHFPDLKVQSKKAEVIKETDNKEETPEVAENDIKAQLAQELSEMNDKKKVDNSAKRFVNHQTDTQCLIYLEVRKPFDPIAIVKAYLNEVIETGKMRTKYIQRLTPISHLSHATEAAFEALCGMICQSHLSKGDEEGKGRKYRIELGKRSHNTLKRDDIIQTVVDSINSPHKIDLSNPDRWVIVEIFKGVAGVSVVSEYDKYRKFNPFSLIEAKNKGEDKRDEL
ncbi:SPOC domain-like protein [Wallemia mellicola]|nr:SPOC domain-like protein [Wallemia mellicola]TIC73848.1 SPOC domain-like protein [Wallemia mellicola]